MKTLDYYENNAPDQHAHISQYSLYVGRALDELSQHAAAIQYYRQAIENLPHDDPEALQIRLEIANTYNILGDKYYQESEVMKALDCYEHSLGIFRQFFPLRVDEINRGESFVKRMRDGVYSEQ